MKSNVSFSDDVRKQNLGLGKLLISKKQVKPVIVINYNINAANCNVLTMMQCVHCLCNIYKQQKYCNLSTMICVDIEVEYFCDNIIYHHSI